LFGHERGAFTGAAGERSGVFEEAHGGTLLLDEIGDLDLSLQAKLLRAVQRGEVQRVGGHGWRRVDVRVLAATAEDVALCDMLNNDRDVDDAADPPSTLGYLGAIGDGPRPFSDPSGFGTCRFSALVAGP
jgi:hypothetical protein